MDGLPTLNEPNGILALVLSIVAGILFLRRRLSNDNSVINRENAETNIIAILQRERASAMKAAEEAWAQRTNDAQEIAGLSVALNAYEKRNAELMEEVRQLSRQFRALRNLLLQIAPERAQEILDSNYGGLHDDRPNAGSDFHGGS